jgi:hypothetical protein
MRTKQLAGEEATIDRHSMPHHEAGGRTAKPYHGSGDLFRLTEASDGCLCHHPAPRLVAAGFQKRGSLGIHTGIVECWVEAPNTRSATITDAPALAKATAVANPMPPPPPVTSAAFPSKSVAILPFLAGPSPMVRAPSIISVPVHPATPG